MLKYDDFSSILVVVFDDIQNVLSVNAKISYKSPQLQLAFSKVSLCNDWKRFLEVKFNAVRYISVCCCVSISDEWREGEQAESGGSGWQRAGR